MKPSLSFRPGWIAFVLLAGAFVVSAARFYLVSRELNREGGSDGSTIIRVAHWQLEPGFREAMQWAIDRYNAQPKVSEAGVQVMQIPIPERTYSQFMNVHLVSGTAPDIAVKKETPLIRGNALAKFFTPLGTYVQEPNPYNAREYQVADLPPKLSRFLATAPWKDTFIDGLQGGYEASLSDYYAIPVSTWGAFSRLVFNRKILVEVKEWGRGVAVRQPQPDWLWKLWRRGDNPEGFLSEDSGVSWLQNEEAPQSLGQLLLYCELVQKYARAKGIDHLVPIAGSRYPSNSVSNLYTSSIATTYWEELSLEAGRRAHPMECLAGLEQGVWAIDSPAMVESIEFSKQVAGYYPTGYLGLDREQAHRRFVLGQAAIIATGGWDVSSIHAGIDSRDAPEERFEIEIVSAPFPTPDERWGDLMAARVSEADAEGAVPFAINKNTPHFEWCLDFLRFLSSQRINEEFAQRAGWLPVIAGANPPGMVEAYMPVVEGVPFEFILPMHKPGMPSNIRNAWNTERKLYIAGEIDLKTMKERIMAVINDPDIGARRAWKVNLQAEQDKSIANGRAMSVERLNAILGSEAAGERERAAMYLTVTDDEGVFLQRWWHELYPDEPYPTFE
jgi:ABC-type glycerol-3-phosphate transport system substrate-binding protein